MTDYRPYRYLDAPFRADEPFADLDALARDIHGWRAGRGLRVEPWQLAWSFPDPEHPEHPERAAHRVVVLHRDSRADAARIVLTAGEDAEALGAALARTKPTPAAKAA
jgi:hypothetical protein